MLAEEKEEIGEEKEHTELEEKIEINNEDPPKEVINVDINAVEENTNIEKEEDDIKPTSKCPKPTNIPGIKKKEDENERKADNKSEKPIEEKKKIGAKKWWGAGAGAKNKMLGEESKKLPEKAQPKKWWGAGKKGGRGNETIQKSPLNTSSKSTPISAKKGEKAKTFIQVEKPPNSSNRAVVDKTKARNLKGKKSKDAQDNLSNSGDSRSGSEDEEANKSHQIIEKSGAVPYKPMKHEPKEKSQKEHKRTKTEIKDSSTAEEIFMKNIKAELNAAAPSRRKSSFIPEQMAVLAIEKHTQGIRQAQQAKRPPIVSRANTVRNLAKQVYIYKYIYIDWKPK